MNGERSNPPVRKKSSPKRRGTASPPLENRGKDALFSPLLEAAFRRTLTPLAILDGKFQIILVNEAYARACRMEAENLLGKDHFRLFPSDAREIFEKTVETKTACGTSERPFVFPGPPGHGETFWDWVLTPLLDAAGEIEVLILSLSEVTGRIRAEAEMRESRERLAEQLAERTAVLDRTSRILDNKIESLRKSEESLRMSEAMFRSVFFNSPIGKGLYDARGSLLQVNRACLRILGAAGAEDLGKVNLFDFPGLSGETGARLAGGAPARTETILDFDAVTAGNLFRTASSGAAHLELHATPLIRRDEGVWGYLLQVQDITAAKESEAALRQALEEARSRKAETEGLLEGARVVLEHHEFQEAASLIFGVCKRLVKAAAGYVAVLSKDGSRNELVHLDAGGLECTVDPGLPMPVRGLRETSYRTVRTVWENAFADSEWMRLMPEGHARLDNVMFAPLVIKGEAVGLLGLANKPGGFNEEDARLAASFGELAAVALFNSRTLDSLERSEERFRAVAETANDAIFSFDRQGTIVYWNRCAERLYGYPREEMIGRPYDLIIPVRHRALIKRKMEQLFLGEPSETIDVTVEVEALRRDGTEFPVELSLAMWRSREGVFYTAILHDISDHRRAEDQIKRSLKEKEILLKEIHHRVKNNLQIVSTLLNLQSDQVKDQDYCRMFKDSQNRVKSMALIHDKLYGARDLTSVDFAGYVRELVAHLFETFGIDWEAVKLSLKAGEIVLGIDTAIPCGLIVNELVSNTLKYAFPGGKGGRLDIEFWEEGEKEYRLVVRDDGVGFPEGLDFRNTETLGLQLVCTLVEQLGGTMRIDRSRGTEIDIAFTSPGRGKG